MSDRCELSDLPVLQCACRVHTPNPYASEHTSTVIVARFRARFDSECGGCGNPMDQGDPIARTQDGYYICQGCAS